MELYFADREEMSLDSRLCGGLWWSVVESSGGFTKMDSQKGVIGLRGSWAHCPGSRGKPAGGWSMRRLRSQEE